MAGGNDVLDDLITLRKGRGLTAARLLQAGAVVDALGGGDQSPDTLITRFVAAMDSLDDPQDKDVLRAAFGLHQSTDGITSLGARRRAYGELVQRTPDTLLDWENRALTALSLRLLTNYYAGAPVDSKLPIPHGGFLMGELRIHTKLRDRRFVEQEQSRAGVSLVSGARGFQYNSNNEETELDNLEGVRVETEHFNGGSVHRLYFPEPLALGQLARFRFVERPHKPDTRKPVPPEDKAGQSFETPTLRYHQRVTFEGAAPAVLWAYNNLSLLERPGGPSPERELHLDGNGSVSHGFSQLYGGLYSGIAWRW